MATNNDSKTTLDFGKYATHCIACFQHSVPLTMFPHRHEGRMVGWVFVCPACFDSVANGIVELIRELPDEQAAAKGD